jgi:hypothetical protein
MNASLRQTYARVRHASSRKLNLFLAKRMGMARVPAIRISRALSIGLDPLPYLRRPQLAARLGAPQQGDIVVERAKGYTWLAPEKLPEMPAALKQGMEVFRARTEAGELERFKFGASRKNFLVYASQKHQSAQYTDLMRLALARPILDAVSRYLGSVPILSNVSVMVSLPNDSETGSQLYHLDFGDDQQIKMFVCLDEVDDEHGPFTFLPVPETNRVIEGLGYDRGRLTIQQITEFLGPGKEIQVKGSPGTGLLVDTSRCLHYGSLRNSKTRIMLQVQYADYYAPELRPAQWPTEMLTDKLQLDEIQRMAIGA